MVVVLAAAVPPEVRSLSACLEHDPLTPELVVRSLTRQRHGRCFRSAPSAIHGALICLSQGQPEARLMAPQLVAQRVTCLGTTLESPRRPRALLGVRRAAARCQPQTPDRRRMVSCCIVTDQAGPELFIPTCRAEGQAVQANVWSGLPLTSIALSCYRRRVSMQLERRTTSADPFGV